MVDQQGFSCAGFALLRSPMLPVGRTDGDAMDDPAWDEPDQLVDYLREAAGDGLVREAIAISSPALAGQLARILAGERQPGLPEVRRVVRALTAYRLRMSTRCTPFGLMAGVAVAEIGGPSEVKVRCGFEHRRAARPERDWLTALTIDWEQRPEVLRQARVVANNLCFVRGGRLVLPYVPDKLENGRTRRQVKEVSVRHTPAVRAVLEGAHSPVRYADLHDDLVGRWPDVPEAAITGLLHRLLDTELLLTDVRPKAEEPNPIEHLVTALAPSDIPELSTLRAIRDELREYEKLPLGQGEVEWEQVTTKMRRLRQQERLVQVDVALDLDVRLPAEVATEAELAADLLCRLAPGPSEVSPIRLYHEEFLERYGVDHAVGVREVLDPDIGLGAPAGYQQPPSHRTTPLVPNPDPERDRLMLEIAQNAAAGGDREFVLTEGHPLLTRSVPGELPLRDGMELFTELIADSPTALREGGFRLVVTGCSDTPGASLGRFAYLVPEHIPALREALLEGTSPSETTAAAQVVFHSRHGRGENVAQTPRLLPLQLPVGVFSDPADSDVVDLDDIAVQGDLRRLFLVRISDGTEIIPVMTHLLNRHSLAPNLARFLSEIPYSGSRGWRAWAWGAAKDLPYTPRVRYGRIVLVSARWRPSRAIHDQDRTFDQWLDRLNAWRKQWQVPDQVRLEDGDQRLELRLTEPLHQRLLRYELQRRPDAVVTESLDDASGGSWLVGPGGAHRNELVFPLIRRSPVPTENRNPVVRAAPVRYPELEHPPGGEWLYVSVRCTYDRQDELLGQHVSRLIAALPEAVDRWHFVRYSNPEQHLRLRFHGSPNLLRDEVLPGVHTWAADLRAHRLIQRISLETYVPELHRYGGPEAIEAAERAFHADSRAVLETLALQDAGRLQLDPLIVAAASYIDLSQAFFGGPMDQPTWVEWFLNTIQKSARHTEFQRRRREAVHLIGVYGDWSALSDKAGGAELLAAWKGRSGPVAEYGRILRETGGPQLAERVLLSLFHMHHNRFTGTEQHAESASQAIARGAVQAHRDRIRSMR